MTAELTLSLIIAVSQYCGAGSGQLNGVYSPARIQSQASICFKKIWQCGHKVKDASAIPFETHNCISKHVDGRL